jgi:hypothetical protein
MATNYGPKIVTEGLVLCLDGGDTLSYPGTGTVWTDLSGVVGNATIYNTPVFSNGSFSFDGFDEYASTPAYSFGSNGITMEIVYRVSASDTHGEYGRILDWRDTTMSLGSSNSNEFKCWVNAGGGRMDGEFSVLSTTPGFYDNWHHAIMTYDKSTVKGYWDNSEVFSVAKTGNLESGSAAFTIALGDNAYFGGDLAIIRVYNRGLSAEEVAQNFNALRGRFGI